MRYIVVICVGTKIADVFPNKKTTTFPKPHIRRGDCRWEILDTSHKINNLCNEERHKKLAVRKDELRKPDKRLECTKFHMPSATYIFDMENLVLL